MATSDWGSGVEPAPAPPERVVARLRPHARVLFWPSVLLVVVAGLTGFFGGSLPETWQDGALDLAAIALVVLLWLFPLLSWLGRRYTITTRRIVIRRGVVVWTRQELLHTRGYDLTVRKNAAQVLFRSGDVLINAGLDRPVVLRDVPHADLVQSTLHDLMEDNLDAIARLRQHERWAAPDGFDRPAG